MLALNYMPPYIGILFVLGLIAAAYSSADSALTSLTTSFCVDILKVKDNQQTRKTRLWVHIGFSILLALCILIFNALPDSSVINKLFKAAGFTYGPLLGLYAFGLLTTKKPSNWGIIITCISAPILSFVLDKYAPILFNGFTFGFLIIALNGFLTFFGLLLFSKYKKYD